MRGRGPRVKCWDRALRLVCDFKVPSQMGDVIDLTLLVERIGRSSLDIAIVWHRDGVERLRARMVTAMMSITTRTPMAEQTHR
jgi:acyl-CoA thioesterase FadM